MQVQVKLLLLLAFIRLPTLVLLALILIRHLLLLLGLDSLSSLLGTPLEPPHTDCVYRVCRECHARGGLYPDLDLYARGVES